MNSMGVERITNSTARAAIEALQRGDSISWKSHFTSDPQLFDDGSPRDFHEFSRNAVGHERFTSIDKIEDNGSTIYGHFQTEKWGDFKAVFKFYVNGAGKVYRLDIAQATG